MKREKRGAGGEKKREENKLKTKHKLHNGQRQSQACGQVN